MTSPINRSVFKDSCAITFFCIPKEYEEDSSKNKNTFDFYQLYRNEALHQIQAIRRIKKNEKDLEKPLTIIFLTKPNSLYKKKTILPQKSKDKLLEDEAKIQRDYALKTYGISNKEYDNLTSYAKNVTDKNYNEIHEKIVSNFNFLKIAKPRKENCDEEKKIDIDNNDSNNNDSNNKSEICPATPITVKIEPETENDKKTFIQLKNEGYDEIKISAEKHLKAIREGKDHEEIEKNANDTVTSLDQIVFTLRDKYEIKPEPILSGKINRKEFYRMYCGFKQEEREKKLSASYKYILSAHTYGPYNTNEVEKNIANITIQTKNSTIKTKKFNEFLFNGVIRIRRSDTKLIPNQIKLSPTSYLEFSSSLILINSSDDKKTKEKQINYMLFIPFANITNIYNDENNKTIIVTTNEKSLTTKDIKAIYETQINYEFDGLYSESTKDQIFIGTKLSITSGCNKPYNVSDKLARVNGDDFYYKIISDYYTRLYSKKYKKYSINMGVCEQKECIINQINSANFPLETSVLNNNDKIVVTIKFSNEIRFYKYSSILSLLKAKWNEFYANKVNKQLIINYNPVKFNEEYFKIKTGDFYKEQQELENNEKMDDNNNNDNEIIMPDDFLLELNKEDENNDDELVEIMQSVLNKEIRKITGKVNIPQNMMRKIYEKACEIIKQNKIMK